MTVGLSLVVVGCSSQKNTENPDKQVAEECVNKIDSIAKGNPARLITWEFVKKTGWLPALAEWR
jgi:hypothetical protein